MADRPILFSGPMIRALLDGRKTMTRRVMKPQPPEGARYSGIHFASDEPDSFFFNSPHGPFKVRQSIAPGDRLWVRESLERANGEAVGYPADGTWLPNTPWAWQRGSLPSIFMPREFSRLTLIVTDVRVQRLQEISEEDARAEGIERIEYDGADPAFQSVWGWRDYSDHPHAVVPFHHEKPILSFRSLWDSLNAGRGYGWDANPWVVALTFTVHRENIDTMAPGAELDAAIERDPAFPMHGGLV